MPEQRIIEGYATNTDPTKSGAGSDSWIDGLRSELRREMIRELALKRIRSSGNESCRSGEQSRVGRFAETLLIGVGVTLVSAWVCSRLGPDRNGSR